MAMLDLLQGMKVVDFSSYVAAPTCAKLLGEYGAEVIRIEPNISDSVRFVASQVYGVTDGTNPLYDVINGNKRQICLNTRTPVRRRPSVRGWTSRLSMPSTPSWYMQTSPATATRASTQVSPASMPPLTTTAPV